MSFDVRGKKILIMGLGLHGGGVGTARFFAKQGALLTITDLRTQDQLKTSIAALKKYKGITYVLGRHRKNDFLRADIIIKNPSVPPTSPYLVFARNNGIPITTDVSIFLRQCPATIIGVTGTRGKSTTCFLIFKFLETFFNAHRKKNSPRVFLGGNIRTSVLDFMDMTTSRDVVVLELSSFQLDDLAHDSWDNTSAKRRSPHVAVLTNILRDHLNWHTNMQSYIAAKAMIFKYQKQSDILFANGSDKTVKKIIASAPSRVKCPQLAKKLTPIVDANLGSHYRSSVALAIGVGTHFNIPQAMMTSILHAFKGLPSRQELTAQIKGISFINDTTATIPDASIAAIKRFRLLAKKSHLILIAGGSDKQLKFFEMAHLISLSVDYLILLPGTATNQLLHELTKKKISHVFSLQKTESMQEAVRIAMALAKKGDYVLLSPGAASFGLFANEFDRGNQFVAAVKFLNERI
ncbi:MAG: UDP-N-acetylmuramoyl-L-alanine--D-glutamate ligase [Patescibacteria group bacterium]